MATDYTHAVVGLAAARLYTARPMPWTYWGLAAVLPIIPDLDVFSSAAYDTILGHRGITHTFLFALLLALVAAAATFRYFRVHWWSLAALFFVIIASHALLDAMTRGGEDVPLFWPLGGRYGNWGPLLLSDMSLDVSDLWHSRACAWNCFGCGCRPVCWSVL